MKLVYIKWAMGCGGSNKVPSKYLGKTRQLVIMRRKSMRTVAQNMPTWSARASSGFGEEGGAEWMAYDMVFLDHDPQLYYSATTLGIMKNLAQIGKKFR